MEPIHYLPSAELLLEFDLKAVPSVAGGLFRNREKATRSARMLEVSLMQAPEVHLTVYNFDHTIYQPFRGVVRDAAEFRQVMQQVGWAPRPSAAAFMTKQLQRLVGARQVLRNHAPVVENICYPHLANFEADVVSVSASGLCYEFEVKVSRNDFAADKRKTRKHEAYASGSTHESPNYFSYVCPEGLIDLVEIPAYAGLYYATGETLTELRAPIRLHNHKHDLARLRDKVNRMYAERHFLGCCRLTHNNRLVALHS